MSIDLVIFDCDGVLVDSEPIVTRAHAETMARLGFPVAEGELLERFCGISDTEMIRILEGEWGRALPKPYAAEVAARISRDYRHSLRPIAGIRDVLDGLRVPCCVASSSTSAQMRLALEATELIECFGPNLFSAEMVGNGKPAPDLFLYAAQQMGVAAHHSIVVEDSHAGIAAATAAGMIAIGFCGGTHCRAGHGASLLADGAATVLDDAASLSRTLSSLIGAR